jgi:hypothetical protein
MATKKKTSKSETGHAKNVANFEKMIAVCKSYGTTYNPSNDSITIAELQKIYDLANTALKSVKTTKTPFQIAVNERQIGFKPLSQLITRLTSALTATKATEQIINDAKTIARKLQGRRAKPVAVKEEGVNRAAGDPVPGVDPPPPSEIRNISASQMSFDSRIDNFDKMVTLLSNETLYKPNEAELKTTALTAHLTKLRKLNTDVINAANPYSNALIDRNKILYEKETGLVDIALEAKNYVKSVFGATHPQYQKISKLSFTRPKR